jgi:ATP-dependent RNA circularization protein (DNA/RNA ligase family)
VRRRNEEAVKEYHKIQSLYKRDLKGNMLFGDFSLEEFKYLANNEWVFTEKVDGTNIRVIWQNLAIRFGGKTDNAQMPTLLYDRLVELFKPGKMLEVFDNDACLYGEGYGAKIQKVGIDYKADGVDFVLFDIRVGNWWLKQDDVREIGTKLGLACVPIIGTGTLADLEDKVRDGFTSMWGDFPAEGIVARPKVELYDRSHRRIITKLKQKDFAKKLDKSIHSI